MKKNTEEWMDVQDQKILLHQCKNLIVDFIMNELDSNSFKKGDLLEKARELIVKLKNY